MYWRSSTTTLLCWGETLLYLNVFDEIFQISGPNTNKYKFIRSFSTISNTNGVSKYNYVFDPNPGHGDGPIVLRPIGPTTHWSYTTAHWSYNPLVLHPIGPTAHWSYSPLVLQPIGPTSHWSYSPLVLQPIGPTAHWSYNPLVLQPGPS